LRDAHEQARRAADAHFSGALGTEEVRAMHEHVLGCDACRGYYERHLLLAKLDPRALDAKARLGASLGFSVERKDAPFERRRVAVLGAAALAFAALMVAIRPPIPTDDSAFHPRGAGARPALFAYRLDAGGGAQRLGPHDTIRPESELAFAYENPDRASHLLIYGVDEHDHVYWYHPTWSSTAAEPRAVAIDATPGVHELPLAVRHALDGKRLAVVGAFVGRAAGVREVEGWHLEHAPLPPEERGAVVRLELEVSP
jgi:hypothetical protein